MQWKMNGRQLLSWNEELQSDSGIRMKCVSGLTGLEVERRKQVLGRYQMHREENYETDSCILFVIETNNHSHVIIEVSLYQ